MERMTKANLADELEFELRGAENLLRRIAERFVDRGFVRESRILDNCASAVQNVNMQMHAAGVGRTVAVKPKVQSAMTAAHEETERVT
jgi:hypothetical protein